MSPIYVLPLVLASVLSHASPSSFITTPVRSLLSPQECKRFNFEDFHHRAVSMCTVKNQVITLNYVLGNGSFGIVYSVAGNKAVKFVENQNGELDLSINEFKMLEKAKRHQIPHVAEVYDTQTDVDPRAKVFVIGMKQYYKSLTQFVQNDVSTLDWNHESIAQFAIKLGVKLTRLFVTYIPVV